MSDSEPIDAADSGTFLSMIMDAVGGIQFKFLGILFLVYLFVSSDIFILGLLDRIPGAVDYKAPTTYGSLLTAAALVMIMFVMDPLIRQKII